MRYTLADTEAYRLGIYHHGGRGTGLRALIAAFGHALPAGGVVDIGIGGALMHRGPEIGRSRGDRSGTVTLPVKAGRGQHLDMLIRQLVNEARRQG